jgi:hypothetical protein
MAPSEFLSGTLVPGLKFMTATLGLKPGKTPIAWEYEAAARLIELAFSGQETQWQNIQQFGGGPGRGPFQFEPPTCGLILDNPVSAAMAKKICAAAGVAATEAAVYGALLTHPIQIAVPFARLDTLCDPRALPPYSDVQAGWICYDREWRPGRARPLFWASVYAQSLAADQAWQRQQGLIK